MLCCDVTSCRLGPIELYRKACGCGHAGGKLVETTKPAILAARRRCSSKVCCSTRSVGWWGGGRGPTHSAMEP